MYQTVNTRRGQRRAHGGSALPYLLIAPSAIFVLAFLVVPVFYAMYCSLYRCDYMNFTKFLGLGNYTDVLTDRAFLNSIALTLRVSAVSLAFALILGVLLAVWIDKCSKTTAYVLQLIVLIPWVISMIVSALLWKWLFQESLGLVNYILDTLGLGKVKFLSDRNIVVWTLIFVMTWRVIAYVMIQVLAGLKAIPIDYEEAGRIDGANRWQLFWRIKMPLLKTPLAISSIIVALSNINNVVVPLTLTGGGPGNATRVMGIQVYQESFSNFHFGESSAMSILMCLFNFILVVLYVKAVKYEIN